MHLAVPGVLLTVLGVIMYVHFLTFFLKLINIGAVVLSFSDSVVHPYYISAGFVISYRALSGYDRYWMGT